jgi:hypothetical protein
MALANFTPSAYGCISAGDTSAAHALPGGTGVTLLVTNIGPSPAAVLLGADSEEAPLVVTSATGVVVLPNQAIALTVGANTHIAAIGLGSNAVLNLARGDSAEV